VAWANACNPSNYSENISCEAVPSARADCSSYEFTT
jgi:hypothetical protein